MNYQQPPGYGPPPSGYGQHALGPEPTLFADNIVTVTRTRAIIAGTTYAMANITSVRTFVEERPVGVVVLASILMVCGGGLGMVLAEAWAVFGVGLLIAVLWFFIKPKHWVRIATAGVESNAAFSHDPAWTAAVVGAISHAIISRG